MSILTSKHNTVFLEKLEKFVKAANDSLTKQEFIDAFQKVIDLVTKIQKEQSQAIIRLEETYNTLLEKMRNDHGVSLSELKKQTKIFVDKNELFVSNKLDKLTKEHEKMMTLADDKIKSLKDGKDGVDGQPGLDGKDGSPDTPDEIVNKLESLEDNDRLDISAVKGWEEIIKELKDKLGKIRGGGSGFGRMGGFGGQLKRFTITGAVNGTNATFTLDKDYSFIMLYWNGQLQDETVHFNKAGRTITFTAGNVPSAGTLHGFGSI